MNKITFPLKPRMQGTAVADLQDALQLLLERAAILRDNAMVRRGFPAALQAERDRQTYGSATTKLIGMVQEEHGLTASGEVDEGTASALNKLLQELGAFDPESAPAFHIVSGRVQREDGLPLQGLRVRATHEMEQRAVRLGEDITDAGGRYTIRYELLPGVKAIALRVTVAAEDGRPLQASEVVRPAQPLEIIDLVVPMTGKAAAERRIEGTIVLDHGLPADTLKVRLYRRDFGDTATLLAETSTLDGGRYAFTYDPGGRAVSLEVRAVSSTGEEVPLSKPLNELAREPRATVNLVAPGKLQPLSAEYRRLSADLTPHVGRMARLAEAKENRERQDLTVLNRATGWDARLIALAAVTERLSADPQVKLPQEAVYGLLRAGLPSDKLLLAQVEPDVVEQALKTVRDAGIVALTDPQIGEVKKAFATFSTTVRLDLPAPGSRSTYGALLKASGLPAEAQSKFGPLYLNHRGDAGQLWEQARDAGLTGAQIDTLRLQGKLAFLAGNSEGMTSRLLQKQIKDPAQLAEQDYDRPETWATEVFEQAGIPASRRRALTDGDRARLDTLIPAAYAAERVEDRLHAYTEDMARKVRLSYPTQVVSRRVETDPAFKLPAAHDATVTLLKNATRQGFRLGETPVAKFLQTHAGVTGGMAAGEAKAAQQQVQMLQRVYQITPSDEAMPVLMQLGMTSAYDVMAYPEQEFRALFDAKFLEIHKRPAPAAMSELISRKARQVSSVTYNLFTIAKKLESEPPVAGLSAPVEVRESVRSELIKQFPTMESLFGSMDFCDCEHCRSVLSPAAYLVDLLQFIDPEPGVWANFLARWQATHNNQVYPHRDANGVAMKPYDVLIERRPDLPHIPLTCENTQTALPYIDIVNEILEYYVAHGKLEEDAARDTGTATTAELLAEPQTMIRGAYDKLREAVYPLNLPFDLWIETARQFCSTFETPLARGLETFRESDALFAPAQPFDRAGIFIESLGLSPAEAALFTDPDPLATWHTLYGFGTAAEATTEATDATTGQRVDLHSAKALSRRLGVSYKELAEIVQTGFVNPKLTRLGLLDKLGVSIRDARFYLDHKGLVGQDPATLSTGDQARQLEVAAIAATLERHAGAFQVTAAELEAELQAIPFDEILVLADPDTGCDFDLTTLQYAGGAKADPITFLRINLFVRLWRALGWTLEETDRALGVFIPQSAPFDDDPAHLANTPLLTALIYLAHLKVLDETLRAGKQSRLKLLTLWSDLPTTGKAPLYGQLFLTRSVLRSSPVFDHPLGTYLHAFDAASATYKPFHWDPTQPEDAATGNVPLKGHLLALQGANGLTAGEIGDILAQTPGQSLDTAALSPANMSLLYRYGLLAKALKLPVRDLIRLKELSGIDPFKPLHSSNGSSSAPLTTLEEDHPFSQTLRFVEIVADLRESGLTVEDLDYLLRHRFDATGAYRPNPDATLGLLKALAEGVRTLRAEHAVPVDAGALGEEELRQKLGLALPADVAERFLAMMNGTVEFTATKTGVAQADRLTPEGVAGEPAIRDVSYNATRQEQKLTYRGVLFDAEKAALQARLPSPILSDLLDDVQQQALAFFETHLQKQGPGVQPAYGFLDAADYALLFDRDLALGPGETEQDRARRQRQRLAETFLPYLEQRLTRQAVVQAMAAQADADPVLVESLVTDDRLLKGADDRTLLSAFAATGEHGVSATFFDSADLSGAAQAVASIVRGADTALKAVRDTGGAPLNAANSARFEGYLEVPAPGAYRFTIELEQQGAEAELRFDHLPEPGFLSGAAAAGNATLGDQPGEFLELKPGRLYPFSLELKKLGGGRARLLVQGETVPKADLAQLPLYPLHTIAGAEHALLLLNKALHLVQRLGLSERDVRYLLTHAADFGSVALSRLPTRPVGESPAERVATTGRFAQVLRLVAYARLKRDLAGGTDDLIDVFEANGTGDLDSVYARIATLARRDEATVKDAAEALFAAPAFESEKPLWRLWDVLRMVERFGVPVTSVQAWTRIVGTGVTAQQRFEIARDLKEAIKARFEPEAWQRVAQPVFDTLRRRQRDALVSHVMHQHGFARMEQVYEYFLIDPGMEPVVQTSRIRLAIGALQVFVQRCLLNLEPHVHPSTLNSKHWEWMKRYRVWEANRKIFLFPENWLEPEFRDDKTHLFAELEGALLQGDVSSDLVEDAFLAYLRKLDELARLDIVAMHIEDDPDPARRTLHVFGRTYSRPYAHFYRRYAHQMWTQWEPVGLEIESDHLAPVVWRDRLYLFWVTFLEKPEQNNRDTSIDPTKTITVSAVKNNVDVQLHWSEYVQGEWGTQEAGEFIPAMIRRRSKGIIIAFPLTVGIDFDPRSVFVHVSKKYEAGEERGVYIHLTGAGVDQAFYLAGRNSAPERASNQANHPHGAQPANPYSSAARAQASRYAGSGHLKLSFQEKLTTEPGATPPKANPSILQKGGAYTLVPPDNNLTALGVSEDAFAGAADPEAVRAAVESGLGEIAALMKPVFYQDNRHTFFIEPDVTETTIEEWQEWVTRTPQPEPDWKTPGWWKDIIVIPEKAWPSPFPDPRGPLFDFDLDMDSLINPVRDRDWLLNPGTGLVFDDVVIGPAGQAGLEIRAEVAAAEGGPAVKVSPGSGLTAGGAVVEVDAPALAGSGLIQVAGGLNVVGSGGFNSALEQNFSDLTAAGFGASGAGPLRR